MRTLQTLVLATALAAITFQTQAATGDPPATATPDSVLILGDSLSSAHRMPEDAGWVALLQQRLASNTSTSPTIHNSSRGGKTLVDGLGELPALLALHHPDVVVIELGGNDAILGVPATDLERDLTKLVDLAQDTGATVTILGFALPPKFDKNGSAKMLQTVYAKVAKQEGVSLLPSLLAGISNQSALLQDDGVHPNAAAQAKVLDNAWGTLRPLLLHRNASKQ